MTAGLRAYQEELKRLVFFRDAQPSSSALWGGRLPGRLGVYRNNARCFWTEALDADFPLTRRQFAAQDWDELRRRYFARHPPRHWELNASLAPFPAFLARQRTVQPWVKELADYEWRDLQVFIDRAEVRRGCGTTNPTLVSRIYRHQIFDWVNERGASTKKPPRAEPEVLVFYRDSRNTRHVRGADPLMLMMIDRFRRPGALAPLEAVRRRLLPDNTVPLETVYAALRAAEVLL